MVSFAVMGIVQSELLDNAIAQLPTYEHRVLYYGPMAMDEVVATVGDLHKVPATLKTIEKNETFQYQRAEEDIVYIAPYDANQIYMSAVSNQGEMYDVKKTPIVTMYNEYFGGGMNSIVFQEMREARGLAYSSQAILANPSYKNDAYMFFAFIATQNDKMKTAIEAFDEIINDMPQSQAAFDVAKDALISRMRTDRIVRSGILSKYMSDRELGITEPREKQIFETVQTLTFEDVKATQEKWVKDRTYVYGVLGDIKDLDTRYLKTLGPVQELSLEEIFGY